MSYILEALKKSQQERELGRVPTLDAVGVFEEDTVAPVRNPWPLVAMGMAGAAVVIALYAALRAPALSPPAGTANAGLGGLSTAGPAVPAQAAPPTRPQAADDPSLTLSPLVPAPVGLTAPAPPEPFLEPEPTAEPLIEPPPLRRAPAPPRHTTTAGSAGVSDHIPLRHPDLSEESDLAAELELQRQLDSELGMPPYEEEVLADPPTPVPRDLIADIEAFKQKVLKDRGGKPVNKAAKAMDEDPMSLRLTREQEADLPPYLMTVHVFDKEQSKRFVLISGRKYREGDKTREGMTVERILTDGAVLSYKGNPFFVHR